MNKEKVINRPATQVAVRCNQCMRIIGYKITAGTGCIQIKCPKCGKEMIVDLSLRKANSKLFYRQTAPT